MATVALGGSAGVAYGLGFGLGRSSPGFAAVIVRAEPDVTARWMFDRPHPAYRLGGIVVSLAFGVLMILSVLREAFV